MGKLSYYEQQCAKKTPLYPNGVRIPFWVQAVREADKIDARRRRKILKKATGEKRWVKK